VSQLLRLHCERAWDSVCYLNESVGQSVCYLNERVFSYVKTGVLILSLFIYYYYGLRVTGQTSLNLSRFIENINSIYIFK
jgi:hypothetical protein